MIETEDCSDWRTYPKATCRLGELIGQPVCRIERSCFHTPEKARMMPEATDSIGAATRVVIFVSEPLGPHNFQSPPARRPMHKPGANTKPRSAHFAQFPGVC